MQKSKIIELPSWMDSTASDQEFYKVEEQMKFVLQLADKNVKEKTGGPFGAAVFEESTGELISVGVNLVVESNCSTAHAEIVAISLAQEKLKNYRLDEKSYVLVSSAQPCVMCAGALLWSGIKKLVYGSNKNDVEEIVGFDEGPIHPDWINEMKKRDIEIISEVLRDEANEVLKEYKRSEGIVY